MQLQKLVQEKESIKWCIIRSMRAWNVNKVVHGEQAPRPHHEFGTVSPSPLSSSINCIDAKRTNQGLWWSLTGQLSWTLVKRRIFGKGASPFTTLIDLKKELSSFG
ncbi:uncharacterized protein [Arachis hypogaea]|uniref:uncharacterized protein isoform X2 n=1 Tax=Arachis hypogaea TaxID=3818 RepID=UPI003B21F15D